ncbi:hypothetical protein NXC24_PB00384 (plasmid) [Rhizobium sp. NXC24]|nr:hypothetical protein NXC24_PB00384 [Rhizobium sp. NXC24]
MKTWVISRCLPLLLTYLAFWNVALGGSIRNDGYPPLPLATNDFDAFVQKLAAEANGSKAVMAERLRGLGFTCTPVSKSTQFECVRFGCRTGFWGRGSLIQWSVSEDPFKPTKDAVAGTAVNYAWVARCLPIEETEEAQKRFLSRNFPGQ